jgi:phosphatidylglycerol:prolipoprotein diacylglycerol transferase
MTAIGIISAYLMAEHRAKARKLNEAKVNKIFGLVIACIIFGYLGSKLLYILTVLPQLLDGRMSLTDGITSGWVVFGGLLGGILGGVLYCFWQKESFWEYADLAIPAVALAQGFGRIGCFFAGCCYGAETASSWFFTEFSHSAYAPNHVKLVPTQLIMSAGDFLICALLLLYEKKWQKYRGEVIAVYLMVYSGGRFLVEFWRGDLIRGQVGVLSTSQFIGLFTAAAGVMLWYWLRKKKKEEMTVIPEEETAEIVDCEEK